MTLTLHSEVVMPCGCCGIPSKFTFRSQSDQIVCERCQKHGADRDKRNQLHVGWWQQREADFRSRIAELEQSVVEQHHRLEEIKTQIVARYFADTPELRRWLQDALVDDAEKQRNSAFRHRDRAMRILWILTRDHQPNETGKACVCGQKGCEVFRTVGEDGYEGLAIWEQRQVARARDGKSNALPPRHRDYVSQLDSIPSYDFRWNRLAS